ncbi:MAG: hypothetical protein KA712_12745 [Myxococcales bacterium]|nr:hypothetical protein [Myxococcales bacterium]
MSGFIAPLVIAALVSAQAPTAGVTPKAAAALKLMRPYAVLAADGPKHLSFSADDEGPLALDVVALTPEETVTLIAGLETSWNGYQLGPSLDVWFTDGVSTMPVPPVDSAEAHTVDFGPLVGERRGTFVVRLRARNGSTSTASAYGIYQVTDIGVVTAKSRGDRLVWATHISAKGPAANARVYSAQSRAPSHRGTLGYVGRTDDHGLILSSQPCWGRGSSSVIVVERTETEGQGDWAFVDERHERDLHLHSPCRSQGQSLGCALYWGSLATNRSAYRPGESIDIVGWIDERSRAPLHDGSTLSSRVKVRIVLENPRRMLKGQPKALASVSVKMGPVGTFVSKLDLPAVLPHGDYNLKLFIENEPEERELSTVRLSVHSFPTKDRFARLRASRPSFVKGQTIALQLETRNAQGSRSPYLLAKYELDCFPQQWSEDIVAVPLSFSYDSSSSMTGRFEKDEPALSAGEGTLKVSPPDVSDMAPSRCRFEGKFFPGGEPALESQAAFDVIPKRGLVVHEPTLDNSGRSWLRLQRVGSERIAPDEHWTVSLNERSCGADGCRQGRLVKSIAFPARTEQIVVALGHLPAAGYRMFARTHVAPGVTHGPWVIRIPKPQQSSPSISIEETKSGRFVMKPARLTGPAIVALASAGLRAAFPAPTNEAIALPIESDWAKPIGVIRLMVGSADAHLEIESMRVSPKKSSLDVHITPVKTASTKGRDASNTIKAGSTGGSPALEIRAVYGGKPVSQGFVTAWLVDQDTVDASGWTHTSAPWDSARSFDTVTDLFQWMAPKRGQTVGGSVGCGLQATSGFAVKSLPPDGDLDFRLTHDAKLDRQGRLKIELPATPVARNYRLYVLVTAPERTKEGPWRRGVASVPLPVHLPVD